MIVVLRYKNKFRRFFSELFTGDFAKQVRVFGIDPLKGGKPIGCQKMKLNAHYDIGMTQICLAGNKPPEAAVNKFIDFPSVDRYNKAIEIIQFVVGKEPEIKTDVSGIKFSPTGQVIEKQAKK